MENGVLRRIGYGLGAHAYGQLVVIAIQLLGVPILLHAWGTHLYGGWLILSAIPAYLSMTDLGFSQSAGNDMTANLARGDTARTLAVFQSITVLVYGLVFVGLAITALLAALLPLGDWIHMAALSTSDLRWILGLLAAEVFVRLCDGVNHAVFRSHGEYALHVSIWSSIFLLQNATVWILALLGHGPVAAALAIFGVRVFETPILTAWMMRRFRDIHLGLTHAGMTELRRLAKPSLANLSMPFAQALNIQGMVLVIGGLLGPVAVVIFSTSRTLARLALRLVQSINYAIQPEIARAYGISSLEQMRQLYIQGMRVSALTSVIAVLLLHFFGGWVIEIWTHGKVVFDAPLFDWLLISSVLIVSWDGGLSLLQAANQHIVGAFWFVVSSATAVVVTFLAIRMTGRLAWAGAALVFADLIMAAYVMRSSAQFIGLTTRAFIGHLLLPRMHSNPETN